MKLYKNPIIEYRNFDLIIIKKTGIERFSSDRNETKMTYDEIIMKKIYMLTTNIMERSPR